MESKLEFNGVYGKYHITNDDQIEVKKYRIALLICGISFTSGMLQWITFGGSFAWIWLVPMSIGLGFALKWVHIYIQILHRALQFFWGLGSIGILILILQGNCQELLSKFASQPILTLLIGPYFAAMTGLGFKEFFCFQRPEAIGLTLFLPIALGSHLLGILNNELVMGLMLFSAILLLILSLRKFGMDPASDIGDKSVFEYLKREGKTSGL